MDKFNNIAVNFSKFYGILPLSLASTSKFLKYFQIFYDICLIAFWVYGYKPRLAFIQSLYNKTSVLTSIGMQIRIILPVLICSNLVMGNIKNRKKFIKIFEGLKDIDEKVRRIFKFVFNSNLIKFHRFHPLDQNMISKSTLDSQTSFFSLTSSQ